MAKMKKTAIGKRLVLGKKTIETPLKKNQLTDDSKNYEQSSQPRMLHVKVKKKAGTIKKSSRLWLQRQLNDPYVTQAKIDGYRSRAAYKLLQINQKYKFLAKGQKIIDLGAAPGGWSQVASQIVHSQEETPSIVALDLLPIEYMPGVLTLQMDFLLPEAQREIIELLGCKPNVVISDMAAVTTGHRKTDHYRTMHVCESAAEFALNCLQPNGHFLAKTFQGGAQEDVFKKLKSNFKTTHHIKPPASRQESVELYILALGFKG